MISFCYVKQKGKRSYYKDGEALKKVGDKIREIRTSKQISQETLAITHRITHHFCIA